MTSQDSTMSKDALLQATLVSEAINPGKLFQRLLDDMVMHLTLFFRLKENLATAKVQVAAMKERNERIENMMDVGEGTGLGQNFNTVR
jgi:chemotaxis methyl-accepting protein methylase